MRGRGEPVDTRLLRWRDAVASRAGGNWAALIAACREAFGVTPDAEVTLETNPETSNVQRMDGFRAAGVNRREFRCPIVRDDELKRLGRLHSADRAPRGVRRRAGRGVRQHQPGPHDVASGAVGRQTWSAERGGVDRGGPDHVSLYLLELYPNAPLQRGDGTRGLVARRLTRSPPRCICAGWQRLDAAG